MARDTHILFLSSPTCAFRALFPGHLLCSSPSPLLLSSVTGVPSSSSRTHRLVIYNSTVGRHFSSTKYPTSWSIRVRNTCWRGLVSTDAPCTQAEGGQMTDPEPRERRLGLTLCWNQSSPPDLRSLRAPHILRELGSLHNTQEQLASHLTLTLRTALREGGHFPSVQMKQLKMWVGH